MYEIRDLNGNEVKHNLGVRSKVLQAWETQRATGVPHYHLVREDLALVVHMTASKELHKVTQEGFEEAVRLALTLSKHPQIKEACSIAYPLRQMGYQLLVQRDDGVWRALRPPRNMQECRSIHLTLLGLAQRRLRIEKPRNPELKSGHGRILERAKQHRDDAGQKQRRPRRTQPTRADRTASKATVAVQAELLAETAALHKVPSYVLEHQGYVIRVEAVPYDEEAEVDPKSIRFLIVPELILERIMALADQGRWETVDELIWALVKARIPVTSRAFQMARKRFSSARSTAELELQHMGYRQGQRHNSMEQIPLSQHKSKVVHWVREEAP